MRPIHYSPALRRRAASQAAVNRANVSANGERTAIASARCPCDGRCPRCMGEGTALDATTRSTMEPRIGANFGDVRIHADALSAAAADRAHARAFTIGGDIYFAAGAFAPNTIEGLTRLAHELVHVKQQRLGRQPGHDTDTTRAEREARDLGAAVATGAYVNVRTAAPHAVQRDGPEGGDTAPPSSTQPSAPLLQLDPEIERLMLQHYIRWWLGSTLVDGSAPTSLPASPDPNAAGEPTGAAPSLPGIPGLPYAPIWSQLPLDPPFFTPLPPDPLFIEPDVGALFSGFGARGAPVGPGDTQAVFDIYQRNQAIAGALPDLRALAPGFLRSLIPGTWRRDIAGALTGAAVGAYLNRDYPTPIEVSDRAWQAMTGASTTVIPLPSISFNLF